MPNRALTITMPCPTCSGLKQNRNDLSRICDGCGGEGAIVICANCKEKMPCRGSSFMRDSDQCYAPLRGD